MLEDRTIHADHPAGGHTQIRNLIKLRYSQREPGGIGHGVIIMKGQNLSLGMFYSQAAASAVPQISLAFNQPHPILELLKDGPKKSVRVADASIVDHQDFITIRMKGLPDQGPQAGLQWDMGRTGGDDDGDFRHEVWDRPLPVMEGGTIAGMSQYPKSFSVDLYTEADE